MLDGLTCEVPYDADANAVIVVRWRMRTHGLPAASLVHVAVFADHEVVANVVPSVRIYVVVLVRTHDGSTLGLGRAVCVAAPVVDYGKGHRHTQFFGRTHGGSSTPLCFADNRRACYGVKVSMCLCLHYVPLIILRFI